MNAEADRFVSVCKPQFETLFTRVNALDESVRGNGKPGLNQRVRDLERCETWRGKVFWMLIGAVISMLTAVATVAATTAMKATP